MDDFSKFNGEGTVLRKAQLREVAILQEVDKICRKHDIKYWIDFIIDAERPSAMNIEKATTITMLTIKITRV